MPYQIRIRRDTETNWNNNDPILGIGELGLDISNNQIKAGDGSTPWTSLDIIRANAVQIQGISITSGAPSNGDVIQYDNTSGTWVYAPMTGGPGGGLTSVGLVLPNIFSVSPYPLTANGDITATLTSQSQNFVFAGPYSGGAGTPAFRALNVNDIPNLGGLYQATDNVLTSISTAAASVGADYLFYTTGTKVVSTTSVTSQARTFLAATTQAAQRTALDLDNTYQAKDATLTSLAGLTITADLLPYGTGADTFGTTSLSSFARTLIDDADAATSRSTLGLGAITVGSTANTFDAIAWDTTPATTIAEAKLQWNTAYSTLELGLDASVTCKIGQGLYKLCHNNTGADINKGDVVFVSGSLGTTLLTVAKARADAESTSATTVGVAAETFSHGTTGFIQVFGFLDGLTTNTISNSPKTGTIAEGDAVYLSESTAGGLRGLLPVQPNHGVRVGFLVKSAGGNGGSIFINVQNYQELDELSDVYIPTTPANNDMLVWNNSTSRWENKTTATVLSNIGAAASSHTHGTISNDGKIGSDAGRVIVTTTNGALQALTDGSANYVLSTNGAGTLSWVAQSGGGGTPGGTDTQVQFNDGGSTFGGDSGLTYNKTTDMLTVVGGITINATNELRLADTDSSHYVGFKSPGTVTTNKVWTLPSTDGTDGQVLKTNGSATLSWGAGGTKTIAVFTPLDNQAPSAAFATLDTQNNISVLDFSDTVNESAVFVGIIPEGVTTANGLYVSIYWTSTSGSTTESVEWRIEFANFKAGNALSRSYDTDTSSNSKLNAGNLTITATDITIGTSPNALDSLVAGDPFAMKITRLATGTTDNLTADAMLIAVELRVA
jgi:hypothetical protein